MFIEVDLISNNKIKNYPKSIPIQIMKISHYRELKIASKLDDISFEMIVTAVLDDLVDWSKVEGIKSVNKLVPADRMKLLFFEMINSKGGEFKYTYTCKNCKTDNEPSFDVKDLKENKLKKVIEDVELKYDNNIITLSIPRKENIINFQKKLKEYLENSYELIKEYVMDYITIYDRIAEINKKINFLKVTANPEITNEDKIGPLKLEANELVVKLEAELQNEEKKNKVKKILSDNFLVSNDFGLIKSYENLFFKEDLADYLTYYPYIKDNDMEIIDYLKFIDGIELTFVKDVEKFIVDCYFGFDNSIVFSCTKCGEKQKFNIDLSPRFFFPLED